MSQVYPFIFGKLWVLERKIGLLLLTRKINSEFVGIGGCKRVAGVSSGEESQVGGALYLLFNLLKHEEMILHKIY